MTDMLARIIERSEREREDGAKRFSELDDDLCMLCDAYGADKRSLFLDCGYAVSEVIPEILNVRGVDPPLERGRAYYLLICKSCRGRLLEALKEWADDCRSLRGVPKDHDGYIDEDNPERNIPVRVFGTVKMMTEDEYKAYQRERP